MKLLFFTAFLAITWINSSHALDRPILSQDGRAMRDGESYYITYTCSVTGDLRTYLERQSRGLFNKISGATEVFAITGSDVAIDANSFSPGNAINPKLVFSVSSARGVDTIVEPAACNGSLIASGSDRPKLAYFLKFTRQTLPSGFATTLAALQNMVAPVYKIVRGHELADRDAENLKQVGEITKTYNDYLALFTEPGSTSKAVPLKVGRTVLTTGAATVTINVKKIENGFLLDRDVPFTEQFTKLVTIKPDFKADKLAISCRLASMSLAAAGFRTPDDQAYILYRLLGPDQVSGKDDYMDCLGRDALAKYVVKNRHLFRRHFPEDLLLTQADLDAPQLIKQKEQIDQKILRTLYRLSQIAGSSENGALPIDADKLFVDVAADLVELHDWTSEKVTIQTSPEGSPKSTLTRTTESPVSQFNKLTRSGFTKFGCFSLTRSETILGGDLDDATAVMLAGRPKKNEIPAAAVALRLFFVENKLSRFEVTDAWVPETKAAYLKTGRSCSI